MTALLAHGDETAISELARAWEAAPAVLAAAGVAALLFAQAMVRLRRRGRADLASAWRIPVFCAGLAALTVPLVSPLDAAGEEYLLSAHMLQHVLIGDLGPALLLLALSGPLLVFFLPASVLVGLARLGPLRALFGALARPAVALGCWLAAIGFWHVPALYDYASTHQTIHDLEHASFVLAGLLVWNQLLDPARRHRLTRGGKLGLAVVLYAAGQVLSAVLVFSFSPLYPLYAAQDERLLGLSALTDQRLAGVVMMADQTLLLGTFAAVTLLAAERERRAAAPGRLLPGPHP